MADKDFLAGPPVNPGAANTGGRASAIVNASKKGFVAGPAPVTEDPAATNVQNDNFVSLNTEGGAYIGTRKIRRTQPPAPGGGFTNSSSMNPDAIETYAHKPEDKPIEDAAIEFLPNVLDNYDSYTYHWKLFITSLEDAASGNILRSEAQSIIAESGVTDLTIDMVELHGIAVPSVQAGTGTQTLVKFEIIEPSGAGLLDKMFYQAVSLGIGNWLVVPCFLQLEFRGRDPANGQSLEDGSPGALAGLKWVWPITLTNSKAFVTHVGTRYNFEAIMYNELAQTNSFFSVQQNTVLNDLNSFYDAMMDLQEKLNVDAYAKLVENYSIPDTYEIVVDPEIRKNAIINTPDRNSSTARGSSTVNLKEMTATFLPGTSIDRIVDTLLNCTSYYQNKMQNSTTPGSTPNTSKTETSQMKKLWRVVTETKPIAFDPLRQDNAVAITIYIVEYDIGTMDVTAAQTGQTSDSVAAGIKRAKEYAKNGIMNKKYDYIFTGLNDQIHRLDLNMNFSFAAAVARFAGLYYDGQTRDYGPTKSNIDVYLKIAKELREAIRWINDPKNIGKVDDKIAEMTKKIGEAQLDDVTKTRYTTLLSRARKENRVQFLSEIKAAGGINSDATTRLNVERRKAQSLAKPVENTNLIFISDVETGKGPRGEAAREALEYHQSLGRGKLRPIAFRENNLERNNASNVDTASNPGRARVASMFSTALYSQLDASLLTLKILIKGDPYWLFPGPLTFEQIDANGNLKYLSSMDPKDAINKIKGNPTSNRKSVNMFGTDNFAVVRFRSPRIYNETTLADIDPYTEVETFSGVYRVTEVVSKFEFGKFTQELSCILDPVINLPQVLEMIEEQSRKQQPTINSSENSSIPTTAVKTTPIVGSNPLPGEDQNNMGSTPDQIGPNTQGTSNVPSTSGQTPDEATRQALASGQL
jgi:hypothetical protein